MQSGRLSGFIDLDWFTCNEFTVDAVNTDTMPPNQPFIGHERNDKRRSEPSASLVRTTSETSYKLIYNGDLVLGLWFADHTKSLVVGVMPHPQAVNEGVNRHTDSMRVGDMHKALDGQLMSDNDEFSFNELIVRACGAHRAAPASPCTSRLPLSLWAPC